MNKRGMVLILSFLLMVVLSILSAAFFSFSINENNLIKRYDSSVKALWLAETGVAEAIRNLPNSPNNGNIGNDTYGAVTTFRTTIDINNYYDINSLGVVAFPGGGSVSRTVKVVAKTQAASNPSKFQYAIDAANDICFGAQCSKDPGRWIHPSTCNGHSCWKESDPTINFQDLFGHQLSDISAIANHYTDSNFPGTVSGVTWVDVASGSTLNLEGSGTGSGVLIVNGNVKGRGTYNFNGIIYVLGTFQAASGTLGIHGSVIVASSAGIDEFNGTADITWDPIKIQDALNFVPMKKQIVAWSEQ